MTHPFRPPERHRTAVERVGFSRSISLALRDGLISRGSTLFDYGCGRGGDVRALRARGVHASGWDPFFAAHVAFAAADVVNLGYVLNVIEDPAERVDVLRRAFALAHKVLIVAVRIEEGIGDIPGLRDGVWTDRGTFQKFYTQREFVRYVNAVLGTRSHAAEPGVAYVFKDADAQQRYIDRTKFSLAGERKGGGARGRRSGHPETYDTIARKLGRVPPIGCGTHAAFSEGVGANPPLGSTMCSAAQEGLTPSLQRRRTDVAVYLALLRLYGLRPPCFRALPAMVRADVRESWGGSYHRALEEGKALFQAIGSPDAFTAAVTSCSLGKRLPGYLYVHRSIEDELPPIVRLTVLAAKRYVGELQYDVAKIAADGSSVSFLLYPGFDTQAHPALARSVHASLPQGRCKVIEYGRRTNPPVLHRKDALVAQTYPLYARFRSLTEQEEAAGLLAGGFIGLRDDWVALLARRGLRVEGHSLVSSR